MSAPAPRRLTDYEPIIGKSRVEELRLLGDRLRGRRISCLYPERPGQGPARTMASLAPLLEDLGLAVRCHPLRPPAELEPAIAKLRSALQGVGEPMSRETFCVLFEDGWQPALDIDGELLFMHDPEALLAARAVAARAVQRIWRCSLDLSRAHPDAWHALKQLAQSCELVAYSSPAFVQPVSAHQVLIPPSIDPLRPEHADLEADVVGAILEELQVPLDRPLVAQVCPVEVLRDPLTALEVFRRVRRTTKSRLVLAFEGSEEAWRPAELAEIQDHARREPDVHLLLLPPGSERQKNALQRAATVILQTPVRHGFGLAVAEALWKGRPVVGFVSGGIPLQIAHRYTGWLAHSIEGAASAVIHCLRNAEESKRLGAQGREHVRENFLITRQLRDYLVAWLIVGLQDDVIRLDG